jgi:thioredoxin 1
MSRLVMAGVVAVVLAGAVAAWQGGERTSAATASPPVASKPVPRLVDLGAGKCIPCKAMAPILEGLEAEFAGRMDVVFIDVWKDREAADAYGIHMIPTQVFFGADGKELGRHEGFIDREGILAKWKSLGVGF